MIPWVPVDPRTHEAKMVDTPTNLGLLLKSRREAKRHSRAHIADALGIPAGTIEGWERGRVAKPPITDVFRLAEYLDIPLEEVRTATLQDAEPVPAPPLRRDGSQESPRRIDPLVETAVSAFGGPERLAQELGTSLTQVEAWRHGTEVGFADFLRLQALVLSRFAREVTNSEYARVADLARAIRPSAQRTGTRK
jgi:transcriptional regulator with XRE-family HTH domain